MFSSLLGRYRRWLWAAAAVFLYALAGFLLTPWLLERALHTTLQERLSLDSRVESIQFNPFTFTLNVTDLEIREIDGAALASLSGLRVNFELSSLFRWAISFDELHLLRPHLALDFFPEGNNIAVLAQRWQESAEPTAESATEPEENESTESSLLRLYIGDLQLIGGGLSFSDHRRPEPFVVELGPIDLQIAELSTLPDSSGTQQVVIRGEEGTQISWTGNLSLNPIHSDGTVTLHGSYSPILYRYLKEQLPVALDGGEVDLGLHYLFSMENEGAPSLTLDEINGSLTGLQINEHDGTRIGEIGIYEILGGNLQWPENTVHVDKVRIADIDLDVIQRADAGFNLFPAAAEPAAPGPEAPLPAELEADQAESAPWEIRIDRFDLNVTRLGYRDESLENARIETEVDIALTDITNQPGAPLGVEARIQPSSGGSIGARGSAVVLPDVELELAMDIADLALTPAQPYLSQFARIGIEGGAIGLQGSLKSGVAERFEYQGSFTLTDLTLNDQVQNEILLSISRLAIDEIQVNTGGLEISSLRLDGPYARIEIEQDGSSNIQRTLIDTSNSQSAAADATQSSESAGEPFDVTVGAIEVSDASARFTDLALPLPFEANIVDLAGNVSAVSTRSRTPAEMDFEGRVNEWGQVTLSGALRPWAPEDLTQVDVKFRNVDMPGVSPYTIKFAGREIASGRTDLDLTYALEDGSVTGGNHLVIHDLTLGKKIDHPDAMSLPLDLAVALLKNSEGVIDLEIPVKGSLDDPEFSYGGAILKVFGNLIVKLVASPFRLLGSLVGVESDNFGAVAFAQGRSNLSPPEQEKLMKLAAALEQRPQLKIAVPGRAVRPADERALARADLESEIEARLTPEQADAAQDANAGLLSERRARVVEALYLEAGLAPAAAELRTRFVETDEAGNETFDGLAFTAAMVNALVAARPVSTEALTSLAADRANAVVLALTTAAISEDRISRAPDEITESEKPVQLPLEVIAR